MKARSIVISSMGSAGFEAHVFESAIEGLAVGFGGQRIGQGNGGFDSGDHAG